MKLIILLTLTLMISGCVTTKQPVPNNPNFPSVECKNIPTIWWGEKGDNPSETNLWKCYDWILEAR